MSEVRTFAFLLPTFAFLLFGFALPSAVKAHPMGNFSINHYSGLEVSRNEIQVRYILDFAEIPTFQEIQALDRDHNGEITPSEREAYLSEKASTLATGLFLHVKEQPIALRPVSSDMAITPGAGGLPTIKVSILYRAAMSPGKGRVLARLGRAGEIERERVLARLGHGKEARPMGRAPAPAGSGHGKEGRLGAPGDREGKAGGEMVPGDREGEVAGEIGAWSAEVKKVDESSEPLKVSYLDQNYLGRAGWKEMAVSGRPGTRIIGSTLPTSGGELRSYPEDEIKSPPQILEARFSFTTGVASDEGTPTAGLRSIPKTTLRWSETLTSLITVNSPGSPMILLSLLVAFGLGTIHALSPGHGKTVVAAYLVGSRGTARHALLLGATVTVSHTIGVFLLGLATLYLSKFFVPERLYPWLGFFSGLSIFMIGLMLLRQRWQSTWTANMPSDHHDHRHGDEGHPADHSHYHHHHGDGSVRGVVGLGVTGGIVPCPSALVVLLSAIAFHQVAFGLLLIVAFSAGIAATLVGIGLVVVYVGEVMSRVDRFHSLTRLLPLVSAAGVALLGGMIALGTWF